MQTKFIKTAKMAGIAIAGVAVLAVWLKLHSDFQKFPPGKFWDPPKRELNQPSAGGQKEKQELFDSLRLPSDTIIKK